MTAQRRFAVFMLLGLLVVGAEACRRVQSNLVDRDGNPIIGPTGPSGGSGRVDGCVPKDCAALNATCGQHDDGCGGTLDCGGCTDGNVCDAMTHSCGPCVPRTCESTGKNCGTISDGCGGMLDCTAITGGCRGNQTCGEEGQANVCGCKSRSCQDLGRQCGVSIDNCGRELDCDRQIGGCGGGQECDPNTYHCFVPNCTGFTTCAEVEQQLGVDKCGKYPNGCGGFVECGICADGFICDKETNECSVFPQRTPGDPSSPPASRVACSPIDKSCPQGFYCNTGNNPPLCLDDACSATSADVCIPLACGERECGSVRDACGIGHACGPSTTPPPAVADGARCPTGTNCLLNACVACKPITQCPPRRCGAVPNGCGGTINCDAAVQCEASEVCDLKSKRCTDPVVRSCLQQCEFEGKNCGEVRAWNGTDFVDCPCGECIGPREACGDSGYTGVCGVTPPNAECLRQDSDCGYVKDSCGNQFACGTCKTDFKCKTNPAGVGSCVVCDAQNPPLTCADYPGRCGNALPDGCGHFLNCRTNCGAAECDTNPNGQTVDVCCAPGQVIALAENVNIPGTLAASTIVGDCCTPDAASLVCPPGYCGNMQDSCGAVHSCGCGNDGGGQPIACDGSSPFDPPVPTLPTGFTPVLGVCCQPGQVIGQADDATRNGISGASGIAAGLNDCCTQEAADVTCNISGAVASTGNVSPASPRFCGARENNCGIDVSCAACPAGSVCSEAADGDGNNDAGPKTPIGQCCIRQPVEVTCAFNGTTNDRCGTWEDNCGVDVNCGTTCGTGRGCQTDPGVCVDCVNFCNTNAMECDQPAGVTGCPACGTCTGSAIAQSLAGVVDGALATNPLDAADYRCNANKCELTCNAYRAINQCDVSTASGLPREDGTIPSPTAAFLANCNCAGNTNTDGAGNARTFCRATGASGTTGLVDNNQGANPTFSDVNYTFDTCRSCAQLCDEAVPGAGSQQCGAPILPGGQVITGCTCGNGCGTGFCNTGAGVCCAAGDVVFGGACCTPTNPTCPANSCDTTVSRGCGLTTACNCAGGLVCNTTTDQCCGAGQVLAQADDPAIPGGAGIAAGACCTPTTSTPPANYCGPMEDSCGRPQANATCAGGLSCVGNTCCDGTYPCGANECNMSRPSACGSVACTCSGGRVCDNDDQTCCSAGQVISQTDDATPGGAGLPSGQCCTPTTPSCASLGTNYCGQREDSCGRAAADCNCAGDLACSGNTCQCGAGTTLCGSQECCTSSEVCTSSGMCCAPQPVGTPAEVDTFCKLKCGSQSRGCGLSFNCGTSHCPGTCSGTTCTCTASSVCDNETYCASNPGAGARSVTNPCGNPAMFTCPACPIGGG